ncbi:hypothetical protein Tco_0474480 [Tanacetum coccineum]
MGNVKRFVAERTRHKRQYDRRVNKRPMQTQESKIDTGKVVDANLVVTKRSRTESEVQDDSSRSGNDTDVEDADIRPIYDEEPMAEIQEKVFAIAALKNDLRKLKGNSVDTKDSSKNMPRFSSNDMVHNHYLDEARKKTQERDRNSKTSVMPSARFQSTAEVNSRAKSQSHKTSISKKPVEQKSHTQKPGRQIFTGHRFSPNKTFVVYEKTSPRSDLSKDDSEPTHGSNVDIHNIHVSKQTLDLCAGTSINVQKEQSLDLSADMIELESLYGPLFDEYFNGVNQVISKSFVVTTTDASNKRQQQPDSTSSTSTLATTVTADGNFDL